MGTIVTFYSYKGGVGRTMALANIATLLAKWGKKVLIVDWDVEAPGVEHFFAESETLASIQNKQGLVDLLNALAENPTQTDAHKMWESMIVPVPIHGLNTSIHLLTAGDRSQNYFGNLRKLDIKSFYEEQNGGRSIENLRNFWKETFDFVLVDSRTGVTDIGGICTIQLPDVLAIVFTATEQSLQGAINVANKATAGRQSLPFDRAVMPVLPIPNRFDTTTEHEISNQWLERFERALAPFYEKWLPIKVSRRDFLALTKIPYIAYFSFGERLPVNEQGSSDPSGLGYAYETLAALIGNELAHGDLLMSNRDEFISIAKQPERLPKIPLRDLPQRCVVFVDFVGLNALRAAFDRSAVSPSVQEQLWRQYHASVSDIAKSCGGELAESDGYSFLFAFQTVENALHHALSLQDSLLVRHPIIGPSGFGPLRVRLGIHASSVSNANVSQIEELRDVATMVAAKAQEGEILISSVVREQLVEPIPNVRFDEYTPPLEIPTTSEVGNTISVSVLNLFRVSHFIRIEFTPSERESLFGQDPSSKGGGGFQALLVSFQERIVKGNQLELTVFDRERIARYAHDYRGGGWQGRLRRIFGRTLGSNLGREDS